MTKRAIRSFAALASLIFVGLALSCTEEWNVARFLDESSSTFSGRPPPPILDAPLWRPLIWTAEPRLSLGGRCHASVEEVYLVREDGSIDPLPQQCATRGTFSGEVSASEGRHTVAVAARNRHGETRGPAFTLERDTDPFHQPHMRDLGRASPEVQCEMVVDTHEGISLVCLPHYGGMAAPSFFYGTRGFIGPSDRIPTEGSYLRGLRLLDDRSGGLVTLYSTVVDNKDAIVAYRSTATGWSAFPTVFVHDPICLCPMTGVLDDDARPVVVFTAYEDGFALVTRRWDGAGWQPVSLPAGDATYSNFSVDQLEGFGVLLSLWSNDALRVLRLEEDRWVELGASLGGVQRPLQPEALFVGSDGQPWLVTTSADVTHPVFRWDGSAWDEVSPSISSEGSVFGAATLAGVSYVGVQGDRGISVYQRSAADRAWRNVDLPPSSLACPVPDGPARMVTGGGGPSVFVGWPCGGDFFVERLRGGGFEDFVTTAGLTEATSASGPAALDIVDADRMYVVFPQEGLLHVDEWDGARWARHTPALRELPIRRDGDRPCTAVDTSGSLRVAADTLDGQAVFRWNGTAWDVPAPLALGENILDLHVSGDDRLLVASTTAPPDPVALHVWSLTPDGWQPLGGALNSAPDIEVHLARLASDSAGRVLLAYGESGSGVTDEHPSRLFVSRLAGDVWEQRLGGSSITFTYSAKPFVHAATNGDIYVLKQEDFNGRFDPAMMKWSDADGAWALVGSDPINVGAIGGIVPDGDASAVWSDEWIAVSVREVVPPSSAPQITFYVNFYTNQDSLDQAWSAFATPLPVPSWGRLHNLADDLLWLSSSDLGGDQLRRMTTPW